MKTRIKKIIKMLFIIAIVGIFATVILPNAFVIISSSAYIKKDVDEKYDYALILGASAWGSTPSPILRDRIEKGVELYKNDKATLLLMSGDNERDYYDETTVMMTYANENGVPYSALVCDEYGLSTYDSMYRAKYVYGIDKMIVVTQKYHLFRAVYIARSLGIDAVGVPAEYVKYGGAAGRESREVLARSKDFFKCMIKPVSRHEDIK